ncbi:MAG: ABC-2 transporter permease [Ruminococcus sp.]|jgi:hypothetical protein|nr:ABC-2 transporter permease [Ruminococcus sp.]
MSKVLSFTKLDFITVKPYLTLRTVFLIAVMSLFLSAVNGNAMIAVGMGIIFGPMFLSYPFALGEKTNMDALYVTLDADRETVVLGRYLFALTVDVLAIAFSVVFGFIGSLLYVIMGNEAASLAISPMIILILAAVLILLEAIQLPIYFKMPYSQAKIVTITSLGIIGGLFGLVAGGIGGGVIDPDSINSIFANPVLAALILIAILAVAVIISYSLSLRFYKKRDF